MSDNRIVLCIMAHPDDAETLCAGTLAMLKQKKWDIHIATMSPGDCGSTELSREKIAAIRRKEGVVAAALLGGTYHCLECDDLFIMYDRATLLKTVELLRRVKPSVVFTTSPSDYHIDHEMTSKLTHVACFAAGVPNVLTPGIEPFKLIPYLYYCDSISGKDKFGKAVEPGLRVDISTVMSQKEKMLCSHASQRAWLLAHHGGDEYVLTMKKAGQRHGRTIGCDYAEAFRQHLDEAFPSENILKTELGEVVHINSDY